MTQSATGPELTVVVPTRNEADNVLPLCARIEEALADVAHEIVFVDDSDDGRTPEALAEAAKRYRNVRFEHRQVSDGLSGAVIRGFSLAKGSALAVLDGDLQHPPEILADMFSRLRAGSDVVVGSRFVPGGSDGGLDARRQLVSFVARAAIWLALHKSRSLRDPTSGCFMLRRAVIDGTVLRPIGWKVLLEVLQRGSWTAVDEVALGFESRHSGRSKLSGAQMVDLLRQLWQLAREDADDRRFYTFALVGLSGVVLNMAIFLLLSRAGVQTEAAAALAALGAMVSNFVWNERYTYRDRHTGQRFARAVKALLTQAVGIGIDTALVALLHEVLGIPGAAANLVGIAGAAGWNYGLFSFWVWRRAPERSPGWSLVAQGVSEDS